MVSRERGAGSGSKLSAMKEALFRFENMEIWQRAADISSPLFKLADKLDQRRYYRFAEQLRAAVLSITNNIAEGSGSVSDTDFANFLNTARRSVFEVANMLILFTREKYLEAAESEPLLPELAEQSRMIYSFRKTLKP
jgi:four helix bundle protein